MPSPCESNRPPSMSSSLLTCMQTHIYHGCQPANAMAQTVTQDILAARKRSTVAAPGA